MAMRPEHCNSGDAYRVIMHRVGPTVIVGNPPYAHIFDYQRHQMVDKTERHTNHVERWFNTLRQRLARFTRKALAFSRRDDLHDGLVRMFI